jgi:hypothetical protein
LRLGLAAEGISLANHGRKSQSFGVMEGGSGANGADAQPPAPKMDGAD